jgi:hypothetical protein
MATTGFSPALLVIGANAMRSAIKGVQAHIDDPGVGGAANKSSAPMVVPAWGLVDANGGWDLGAPLAISGGQPNGPIPFVSLWSDTSGSGTWYGNVALGGDVTFDSNGAYTVESLLTGGSSS